MNSKMSRRVFAEGLVLLPMGLFLVHCSGSDDNSGSSNNNNPPPQQTGGSPGQTGRRITYTSSVVASHAHTFSINSDDFTTPPSGGDSGSTSQSAGHHHQVSVTSDQLASIGAGQSITVTTSLVEDHTHDFTFTKMG